MRHYDHYHGDHDFDYRNHDYRVHACWSEGEQLDRTNGLTTNDTAGGSGNAPASVCFRQPPRRGGDGRDIHRHSRRMGPLAVDEETRMIVLKFGGTSVGNIDRVREATRIIEAQPKPRVAVVSAAS